MNAEAKINIPALPFEAFNALDICVESEIAEVSDSLRVMPATAALARANLRRYLERLQAARTLFAAARPAQYREMIQSQFARDSICDA
jgi:hypothetical protein